MVTVQYSLVLPRSRFKCSRVVPSNENVFVIAAGSSANRVLSKVLVSRYRGGMNPRNLSKCYDQLCLLGNVGQTGFQSNGSDHTGQVSREEQSGQVEVRLQLVSGLYIFGR